MHPGADDLIQKVERPGDHLIDHHIGQLNIGRIRQMSQLSITSNDRALAVTAREGVEIDALANAGPLQGIELHNQILGDTPSSDSKPAAPTFMNCLRDRRGSKQHRLANQFGKRR